MISIISNEQLQETQQNNIVKINSDVDKNKNIIQIRKKNLIIFLIVSFVLISVSVLTAGIVYGVLINNKSLRFDNHTKTQAKDARGWFNPDTASKFI